MDDYGLRAMLGTLSLLEAEDCDPVVASFVTLKTPVRLGPQYAKLPFCI
jgi:hypothetical protein